MAKSKFRLVLGHRGRNLKDESATYERSELPDLAFPLHIQQISIFNSCHLQMENSLNQSIRLQLGIIVWEKEQSLPLVNTGISTNGDGKLHRNWNEASPQRYVVNGELKIVPHDYCPGCWGNWLFKTEKTTCPECGIKMGKECKILLDTDVCPYCEKGKLSMNDSQCDKCGFSIDPRFVAWG